MARKTENIRPQKGALTADEAEELFSRIDHTGHTDEDHARRRRRNKDDGPNIAVASSSAEVDPLTGEDPSGSVVEKVITRTAITFVLAFAAAVVVLQVVYGLQRRLSTSNLYETVNVRTVAAALEGGVEWGDGFTQFPEDFTVQEADENTGRVEVTVINTSSSSALGCFSTSQVQATAFAVNALLNPNIDTVVYHVSVHVDDDGNLQQSSLFGFLKPTGDVVSYITFVWTKTQSSSGVNFRCTIAGIDETIEEELRNQVTTSFTPVEALTTSVDSSTGSSLSGSSSDTD